MLKTFISFIVMVVIATMVVSAYQEVDVIVAVQMVGGAVVEGVTAVFSAIGSWLQSAKGVQ